MILWTDGEHDPAENMRRDGALLAAAEAGASPVLRLFGFRPHGITLGRLQRAEEALDRDRCNADQIPWAVRPTGGRAIFHAEEWTFSLAAPLDDASWGGNAAESYGRLASLIASALERLGVPAELARGSRRAGKHDAAPSAAACFAASARHEILAEGRKLVGIAQRRTRAGLLLQGSILLGEGHLRLADYVASSPEERASVRQNLARVTALAAKWLPARATLTQFSDQIEALLPPGCARVEGEAGRYLLALDEARSYTALDFAN